MSFTFKRKANRKYVSSKIIYFIEYDDENMQLKIGFNDGLTGYFNDVPKELITKFESARSKGNFFYKNLFNTNYQHHMESI